MAVGLLLGRSRVCLSECAITRTSSRPMVHLAGRVGPPLTPTPLPRVGLVSVRLAQRRHPRRPGFRPGGRRSGQRPPDRRRPALPAACRCQQGGPRRVRQAREGPGGPSRDRAPPTFWPRHQRSAFGERHHHDDNRRTCRKNRGHTTHAPLLRTARAAHTLAWKQWVSAVRECGGGTGTTDARAH